MPLENTLPVASMQSIVQMPLTFGSLFSGIGGIDLGFERAGMVCKWQVEIDDYATRVLEKHWPSIHRERDIRDCGKHNLEPVDVVCAGFPCQDISSNNQYKQGIEGSKSGLFHQVVRIVRDIQPRVVMLENVSDLLVRGMGTVLGELAAIGFDAWWDCVPAAMFGLPQRRWRTYIVAYANGERCQASDEWLASRSKRIEWGKHDRLDEAERRAKDGPSFLSRVDDGIPRRVDRLRCLGNAVCPQAAEWIGRRIVASCHKGI